MNTIMRAPGDFQGAFFMEAAIEAAARAGLLAQSATNPTQLVGMPLDDVRPVQEANMDAACADVWGEDARALDPDCLAPRFRPRSARSGAAF